MPSPAPDPMAVRAALWRALHLRLDAAPHVFTDDWALRLAAPQPDWTARCDMDARFTRPFRAMAVAQARYVEDLVGARAAAGVRQYVLLGAGLDSFALRQSATGGALQIFELDAPGPQAWKQQQIAALGAVLRENVRLLPVDVAGGDNWSSALLQVGFSPQQPAIVAAMGLSCYLDREANAQLLRQVAALAPGSAFVMSFPWPMALVDADLRPCMEMGALEARERGTPYRSAFTAEEAVALALAAGCHQAWAVSGAELADRYFAARSDGLRPPVRAEDLLVVES